MTCSQFESQRSSSRSLVTSLFAILVLCGASVPASAAVGDYRCTDPSKVYFGKSCLFRKPCTISSDRVYRHIPEYQEIVRRGLTEKDVDYHFLMKKASARFGDAVKKMARAQKRDLVAETGVVVKVRQKAADIPDYTEQTIAQIK